LLTLRIEGMDFTVSLPESAMRQAARWLPEQAAQAESSSSV